MRKTFNLFEFQNQEALPHGLNPEDFFGFLDKVWQEREKNPFFRDFYTSEDDGTGAYDSQKKTKQQFLSEGRHSSLSARNYVGIIHYDGYTFNLLPKIFNKNGVEPDIKKLEYIQKNILWWLSYSKRLKLPKFESDYNKIQTESFFEILVYLFATFTAELFTRHIYQNYTDVERELPYVKGRIDMNAYISTNLCTGNWGKISCVYDSFEIDNLLNRIIKYVCKLLLPQTRAPETKRKLNDILFTLDVVTNTICIAQDCERVKINPLFSEIQIVLDYCKLFLTHSMVFTWKNELKVFAFLLPMEKVFEEFVAGFIEKHKTDIFDVKNLTIISQSCKMFLATDLENNEVFKLKPDIVIKSGNDIKWLIDCKYKLIYQDKDNIPDQDKDNIPALSDMYQMLAYAVRHKCTEIKLFYPQCEGEDVKKFPVHDYLVKDEFSDNTINISVYKIPVILSKSEKLESIKENKLNIETNLVNVLNEILNDSNAK